MGLFGAMDIAATGLTAQRLRLDVIASNLANVETTRTPEGGPYRRREVILQGIDAAPGGFSAVLAGAGDSATLASTGGPATVAGGVQVAALVTDERPFKVKYAPGNPDADARGFVQMPNVDPTVEMIDLLSASRAYEANMTVINAAKAMAVKALELGK